MDPKKVDPAFGHLKEFSKVGLKTTALLHEMREEVIFKDGAFEAKYKALIACLWGVAMRCEPCLTYYMLKAKELGVTEAEVGEVLAIGSTMGGCVGETWALKAYKAFKEGDISSAECVCDLPSSDNK
ncbi:MAG: carboxymuconolactone decarboxylase family protein [Proteobacteria bacterium]|nr:carboxymuconolactone decarboxylase family protein [Pseudomonadota bacterium]